NSRMASSAGQRPCDAFGEIFALRIPRAAHRGGRLLEVICCAAEIHIGPDRLGICWWQAATSQTPKHLRDSRASAGTASARFAAPEVDRVIGNRLTTSRVRI